MVSRILNFFRCVLLGIVVVTFMPQSTWAQVYTLESAPSRVDNPLKGLVPYSRPHSGRFPHSMEFSYLACSDLMKGERQFDWKPLDDLLDDIASRGNQAVIRIYLEYPGKDKGIPEYLIEDGLKVHRYLNENTAPLPPAKIATPDYEDPRLRKALQNFIAAFGERYDGDPRLGYITAGLLGTWGEWHTYPRNDLWASRQTQKLVLDAYEQAFKRTPILLRYPAGPNHGYQSENASRPFGYHDDSFAWATLDTGKPEDSWYYMPALTAAGDAAKNKWKTQPIGGEIRPEAWGKVFDRPDQWADGTQDFRQCIGQTHATWLMDTGMFREVPPGDRKANAEREVRRMGYDLFIAKVRFEKQPSRMGVELELTNQGVAPFYADWPTEVAFVRNREVVRQLVVDDLSMKGHLPGNHTLKASVDTRGLSGEYLVLMRVVNPLPGGKSLGFANAAQDATLAGWLTLGRIEI
ncbi:DUF4832 domain-containing protein [Neorhodopirellula pilleata]|uniref:Uncharacterized protein n=1 Tax=Neorhodopirellula pilleata TaxID=2714738 RepID=A0A5C5ZH14_9BACT|nr:DUF4832 domain-containing protein [Neorhodopirellula pilleata]TWT86347.1 hypothetical protein Pla100_61330 [Neorhodopirellula pilleata]